jgi:hypothetical protein
MTTKQSAGGKVAKVANATKSPVKSNTTRTTTANEQHKENAVPMPADLLEAIYEVTKRDAENEP